MINKHQKTDALVLVLKSILVLAYILMFGCMWYNYYAKRIFINFFAKGDVVVILLFTALVVSFSKLYGGFDIHLSSVSELIYSFAVASVISGFFIYIILLLLMRVFFNVIPLIVTLIATVLVSALWAKFSRWLLTRLLAPKRIVLIYDNAEARDDGLQILSEQPKNFNCRASLNIADGIDALFSQLSEIHPESVMICGISSSTRNDIMKYCVDHNIEAFIRPNIGDFMIQGASLLQMSSLPVLVVRRSSPPLWYLITKRAMDVVLSIVAILVFSPFMLVTAAAIKLYDHGPILYRQIRLTKDRKEFYVYKFRSMRVDAEKDGVARLASQDDDRITPVGKIIRSLRIDEMPQLFCILMGTMTIVGPRPERPEIAEQYEKEMPEFALRLQCKAGLTGYAQVYGKYNTTPYNKLQMDLQYISHMNLAVDLKIIFATIKILFEPESTEGVAAGQTTAKKENDTQQ